MANEYYRSPVGILKIVSDGNAITEISVSDIGVSEADELTAEAVRQLTEYFDGKRTKFELPINPDGTAFCRRVWQILTEIPFGKAFSYGQVAELTGNKQACRAIGNAVGNNPILIVIPCHRVVAKNSIGGFSAGIEIKKFLLKHENISI